MRIINQRGNMSLNFESIIIMIDEENICTTLDGKVHVLGKYASEKRAKEVFEDIHYSSYGLENVYCMPEE